jgi:DNA invertase Pin-like site-specific DNA recombinase
MSKGKRAALYLRVSTDGQNTNNQHQALTEVAGRRGWTVTATYEDAGISGTKGRDRRPGFDAMLRDATRRRFDVLMFWSIDRLGRSTAAITAALADLEATGVVIYADKEAMDATTPHARAMLHGCSVRRAGTRHDPRACYGMVGAGACGRQEDAQPAQGGQEGRGRDTPSPVDR